MIRVPEIDIYQSSRENDLHSNIYGVSIYNAQSIAPDQTSPDSNMQASNDIEKDVQLPNPNQTQMQGAETGGNDATPPDQSTSEEGKKYQNVKSNLSKANKMIIVIAIVIIIAAGSVLFLSSLKSHGSVTTTTIKPGNTIGGTTTIGSTSITSGKYLAACTDIKSSGTYSIGADIKTKMTSGPCINITSSNVALICDNKTITGSGPFVGVPPFSYGIYLDKAKNVSIDGCDIGNFSYGIYSVSSSSLSISYNRLTPNYMSNLYLQNTSYSTVNNNYMSGTSSMQGSSFITQNSSNNKVYNNIIDYNQFYGIVINGSNNTFISNYINHTESSFYCTPGDGFIYSGHASGNTCYNSTGCDFAVCMGVNIPANLSYIKLHSVVNSCGSINSPGIYEIGSSISMSRYANISNPLLIADNISCIAVKSSNVDIECNNHTISNASIGIYAEGVSNLTLNRCNFINSGKGIELVSVDSSYINETTYRKVNSSIALYNTSGDLINNIDSYNATYGVYIKGSQGDTIQNFNLSHGEYGAYIDTSLGNEFNNGIAYNNTKIDVYATLDSIGQGDDIMQLTKCGVTNALWANCKYHVGNAISNIAINSCGNIDSPGSYVLSSNIINASTRCIEVNASNVKFMCEGHIIEPSTTYQDSEGIVVSNAQNVSFSGCHLKNFYIGVNISNVSKVSILNMTIFNPSSIGIVAANSNNINISKNNVSTYSSIGVYLSKINNSMLLNNKVLYSNTGTGIVISGSDNNNITNNTGTENYIGMDLNDTSVNNIVSNNTMQLSGSEDYVCDGTDSNMSSEYGGINYGTKKIGCYWMAAVPSGTPSASCESVLSPEVVKITSDGAYFYGAGAFCFRISANNSIINCQGHTILSTDGGTFAYIVGAANVKIENCYIKGFGTTIEIMNSTGTTVINSTIYGQTERSGYGILADNADGIEIANNHITNVMDAYYVNDTAGGTIVNNFAGRANLSYSLYNSTGISIENNTASKNTMLGIIFYNSLDNVFSQNKLYTDNSISCSLSSESSSSNLDTGGNICVTNTNCEWINQSSESCK